jgi:arylsulfatase A-like enzyme
MSARGSGRARRRIAAFGTRASIPLLAALAVATGVALAGNSTPPAALEQAGAAQARPNVLVIETDDQTLESMRVMRSVNTLIGAQGVTFTRSFVNYSLCCPSRATFLTGQYAHNHRVWTNTAPDGGFGRFEALHANNNLAIWLRGAGYHTGMIGKYLNGYENESRVPVGWSEWHALVGEPYRAYDYALNNNGTRVRYGHRPAEYQQDVLTRKAVDFVDRRSLRPKPFFLWLTYTAPHSGPDRHTDSNPPTNCDDAPKPPRRYAHAFDSEPLPRPPDFDEPNVSDKPAAIRRRPPLNASAIAYIERNYRCELESLLAVDDGVEQVIAELKANGVLDDTLVIYTSDNGFFHGEHRIAQGKTRLYEESIRVPLEMRGPGIPRGASVDSLVTNADLAPTIVDAANAAPRLVMDGRSLLPVAETPGIEHGRQLLVEQPGFEAIRTRRYVYAEYGNGERELYDLKRDPYELHNRNRDPAYASAKAELASRLELLRGCAGSTCRLHRADPPGP